MGREGGDGCCKRKEGVQLIENNHIYHFWILLVEERYSPHSKGTNNGSTGGVVGLDSRKCTISKARQ